ncbi:hypothetical protein V2E24_03450 [Mycoplasmopsis ciconiae]|uniref:Uncharacterized protein n=1 Tax=Mycoplasmopsis ciconiae TaxID=561067 RepID=A0ABU7MM64_9BACT|nr:hypothetical protein [Mycoplasmopsis ciconiae]
MKNLSKKSILILSSSIVLASAATTTTAAILLNNQNKQIKSQLQKNNTESEEIKNLITQTSQHNSVLNEQINNLKNDLSNLNQDADAKNNQLADVKNEIINIINATKELEEKINQDNKSIDDLINQSKNQDSLNNNYENQIENFNSSINSINNDIRDLKNKIIEVNLNVQNLIKESSNLTNFDSWKEGAEYVVSQLKKYLLEKNKYLIFLKHKYVTLINQLEEIKQNPVDDTQNTKPNQNVVEQNDNTTSETQENVDQDQQTTDPSNNAQENQNSNQDSNEQNNTNTSQTTDPNQGQSTNESNSSVNTNTQENQETNATDEPTEETQQDVNSNHETATDEELIVDETPSAQGGLVIDEAPEFERVAKPDPIEILRNDTLSKIDQFQQKIERFKGFIDQKYGQFGFNAYMLAPVLYGIEDRISEIKKRFEDATSEQLQNTKYIEQNLQELNDQMSGLDSNPEFIQFNNVENNPNLYNDEKAKSQSFVDEIIAKKSQVLNSAYDNQLNSIINYINSKIREADDMVAKSNSTVAAYSFLKAMNSPSGFVNSEYNKAIKIINDLIAKQNEQEAERQRAKEELERIPNANGFTQSEANLQRDMEILNTIPKLFKPTDHGDYYKDADAYYPDLTKNTELQAVLQKYYNLVDNDIFQGYGEYASKTPGRVTIDPADIPALKPLIDFNDKYTKYQLEKYNLIRRKFSLNQLNDLTTVLSDEDKAKLILQAMYGYVRGIYILTQKPIHNGKKLSTGHSFNEQTKEVTSAHKLSYGENYYASYNNNLLYVKNPDTLNADFVSTVFFKAIVGERSAYEKDFRDGELGNGEEWGHLLNTVYHNITDFYGVVLAFRDKEYENKFYTDEGYKGYRLSVTDMTFKKSR